MRALTVLTLLTSSLPLISSHTVFTTLFVNSINQGDGTCVRMPRDGSTSTAPIRPIDGADIACGRDGATPVPFTCPAPAGSTLTFEFREYADASQPGALDPSHKGPCAVYLKQVDNMTTTPAAGEGWFKIWEAGYDEGSGKWCTEKLMEDKGLLSVALPSGLPTGYFLVRPELLALQQADKGDPQFYAGCAQVFVTGGGSLGTLDIPADKKVSIPGHVEATDKGLTFNIYDQTLALPYPIPGPAVYFPTAQQQTASNKLPASGATKQTQGVVPEGCLLKNANWCGFEVRRYTDEDGCWAASEECWAQAKTCYDEAPPTGSKNCGVWEGKCKGIQDGCNAKQFSGPPAVKLVAVEAAVPGTIPGAEQGTAGTATSATVEASVTATAGPDPAASGNSASPTGTTGAAAEPTDNSCPAEVLSKDGTCGGDVGQTCRGSEFGSCCSRYGRCGSTRLHCGCGCQSAFGQCN